MRRLLAPVPVAVLLVCLALVALLAYGLASNEPDRAVEDALSQGEREEAPGFELPTLSGEASETLEDYRGQVVVLNFWASWCEPCRAESPLLQRWHERIEPDDATVLGVAVRDLSSDAEEFVDEYRLDYPMLRDGEGATQEDYAILALPETFVIDRKGRVAAVRRGEVDEAFMQEHVMPLLKDRS